MTTQHAPRNSNPIGQRFSRLVVLSVIKPGRRARWMCRCDCGTDKAVNACHVRRGVTKSCGCLRYENRIKHGHARGKSLTYSSWASMIQRCTNPASTTYPQYGGRGITVCERWKSFEAFLADVGERPSSEYSIDRKDNTRGYEPGNCRWATRAEQGRNTRQCKLEPHEPEQIRWLVATGSTRKEVARFFGVTAQTVRRVVQGKAWA